MTHIGIMLLQLYVPKDDFPRHPNDMDVHRKAKTSIDELQEAIIVDYWNIDGERVTV